MKPKSLIFDIAAQTGARVVKIQEETAEHGAAYVTIPTAEFSASLAGHLRELDESRAAIVAANELIATLQAAVVELAKSSTPSDRQRELRDLVWAKCSPSNAPRVRRGNLRVALVESIDAFASSTLEIEPTGVDEVVSTIAHLDGGADLSIALIRERAKLGVALRAMRNRRRGRERVAELLTAVELPTTPGSLRTMLSRAHKRTSSTTGS